MKRSSLKDTFLTGTPFKFFLICVLTGGLAFGLYRGMPDNYLADFGHRDAVRRLGYPGPLQQRLRRFY